MAEHARVETESSEPTKAEGAIEEITVSDLKPTSQTIARTIIYFISWINMLFAFFGMPQLVIDPDMLTMVIEGIYIIGSAIVAFVSSTWSGWKNNSYTKAAIFGDDMARTFRESERL